MDEKEYKKWKKIRKKGKLVYIFYYWVLGNGIILSIVWSFVMELVSPSHDILVRPIIAMIVFPITSYLAGLWTWNRNEKRYLERAKR